MTKLEAENTALKARVAELERLLDWWETEHGVPGNYPDVGSGRESGGRNRQRETADDSRSDTPQEAPEEHVAHNATLGVGPVRPAAANPAALDSHGIANKLPFRKGKPGAKA